MPIPGGGTDLAAERAELLLGFLAAFLACLVVGLVDHYFFNPRFPQMAALLWTLAGVLAAMSHPAFGADASPRTLTRTATRTATPVRARPRRLGRNSA